MKRAKWLLAAWAVLMVALALLAWLFSVPALEMNSYRTFGAIAVWLTAVPSVIALLNKGLKE